MKALALTGGVASGKNFIANIFEKNFRCKTFDADQASHDLLEFDQDVIEQVSKIFPESFIDDKINRKRLGSIVFKDDPKLEILENIIHPKVQENYQKFLADAKSHHLEFVILNIPLILEKGHYDYDHLIAIITDFDTRKRRYIKREQTKDSSQSEFVLERKFINITSHQIQDDKRIELADFVIDGSLDKNDLKFKISQIMLEVWDD